MKGAHSSWVLSSGLGWIKIADCMTRQSRQQKLSHVQKIHFRSTHTRTHS